MVQPPHWLKNKGVDQIVTEEHGKAQAEFKILADEEERGDSASNTMKLSAPMNQTWEMEIFWYSLACPVRLGFSPNVPIMVRFTNYAMALDTGYSKNFNTQASGQKGL
ncbi:hypothetical protein ACJ72_02452 [Emergomyces africanus]|uniref:Uncharacterized protein n=1 Tax=Emergomyces africanus TaxID=1955775 RepID=A0A1B7P2X0_9EURO|nr:hypothetical protein ACJ72_02452 [Emergomyces africanus]